MTGRDERAGDMELRLDGVVTDLIHFAQINHQAHHHDHSGTWLSCTRGSCNELKRALSRALGHANEDALARRDRDVALRAAAERWGKASVAYRAMGRRYGDATITSEEYWAGVSRAQDEVEAARKALAAAALALVGAADGGAGR